MAQKSATLSREQRDWIDSSATFILGTYADGPNGGADASNRGGNPGFVRALDYHTIIFPDYKVISLSLPFYQSMLRAAFCGRLDVVLVLNMNALGRSWDAPSKGTP